MLNSDNRLNIYEDQYGLNMELRWFSPVAIFLAFFCIAWMSFLAFWYGMAISSDGPWIMFIFPIVHVAVGVGLSYFTLCKFFNKSYININNQHLSVQHSPIPWWKGGVDIPSGQIDQVFVKEKKKSSKNGSSYSYAVVAKLVDGSTQNILDIDMSDSQKALELEKRIEEYLGIMDSPVAGEYGKSNASRNYTESKKHKRRLYSSSYDLINKKTGDQVRLDGNFYDVTYHSQYDWKNGNSDKLLQLINIADTSQLLFIKQDKGIFKAYLEDKLGLAKANEFAFNLSNPPSSINLNGDLFEINEFSAGDTFLGKLNDGIETKQWFYLTSDGKRHIRIVSNDNQITYYKGTLHEEDYLDINSNDHLDLNQSEKEIRPNLDERDFV